MECFFFKTKKKQNKNLRVQGKDSAALQKGIQKPRFLPKEPALAGRVREGSEYFCLCSSEFWAPFGAGKAEEEGWGIEKGMAGQEE